MLMCKYHIEMLLVHNKFSSILITVEVLRNFGGEIAKHIFSSLFLEC